MPRMIREPEGYFAALDHGDAEYGEQAEEIYLQAAASGVPIIGPVMGRLLHILCRITNARRILELGSAMGYSTLFLASAARINLGSVLGVEMNPVHCRTAQKNLGSAGLDDWSRIVCADARRLPLGGVQFDMIFLDVDQRYYAELESVCHERLKPGGLLVADNTAFEDARDFNELLSDSARWMSVNLLTFLPFHAPEHDGLCMAMKI